MAKVSSPKDRSKQSAGKKELREGSSFHALQEENRRLLSTLDINALLSSTLHLDVVMDSLLRKAEEVCNAEASSLMLVDEEKQELYFHTVKGGSSEILKEIRLKIGEGLAGWVAQHGKPVLVPDCSRDSRFFRKADQKSHFHTRTMMCVPLQIRNRTIGTIQVLNRHDNQPFEEVDLRIFTVLANQAAIAIQNARLHRMATVDGTTGLYRKNYFMARLEEEFLHCKNSDEPMSVLMSDIDHFKRVNDRFGHQGGDQVLVEFAAVLMNTVHKLGTADIAGRYGGEEFCVLLPGSDVQRAEEVGNLICENIRNHSIKVGEQTTNITISIGISVYPLHANNIEKALDFIRLSDEALYICKNRGRNCVSLYEEQPVV